MNENARISALEAELQLRKKTILFLVAEYAARNAGEHAKIIAFLQEIIPDMSRAPANVAQEVLDEFLRP
ncbi:hypothetical protein [Paracoccus sp. (in: a-proteobacteria)]|uniref:hypothetical protein n=1 Tax=Paracoccus sp. TaxID=267 RepID=UPI0028A120A2|nr:hypothetical protein [Paracoccus sp. (in: a-proteobacteria)]